MRTLLIDNYDSYTYNLFQLIAEVNRQEPIVVRNDQLDWDSLASMHVDNIVISPGPGRPENERDFGICRRVLLDATVPVLGVCLGHQGLGFVYGADVIPASEIVHGRPDAIFHDGSELFEGIPQGFRAVRYHSLVVRDDLPTCLEKTAWTADGTIMGLRHRDRPLWGVQYHPESICTEHGRHIIENFHTLTARAAGVERPRARQPIDARRSFPAATPPNERVVLTHRLDTLLCPEQVFVHLYGDEPYAFWLDSSRIEQNLSRFSFMGANSGPLSQVVEYRSSGQHLTVTGPGSSMHLQMSIFEYLDQEIKHLACHAPDLPFDLAGGFVGYFGYELKAECGSQPVHSSSLPDAMFILADQMIVFDHLEQVTYLVHAGTHGDDERADAWFAYMEQRLRTLPPLPVLSHASPPVDPTEFRLHQPYPDYLDAIERCRQLQAQGESYEICLTTQISSAVQPDPLTVYRHLRRLNPAPHAAFLHFGKVAILSSSPERFLNVDRERRIEAKPIKGTARRGTTEQEDARLRHQLQNSEKTRSENLMIVDLLRNDLGLVSEIGSVHVPKLMAIESYATVHQIVSTICGTLRTGLTAIDCIRAAFPGGSMTGAPKLRTMEIIDALEGEARGVYAGALGFLGLNGTADLSVVIRTIVTTPETTLIGAGGAITIQSDPEAEFDEMLLKARPLMRALARASHGQAGQDSYYVNGDRVDLYSTLERSEA